MNSSPGLRGSAQEQDKDGHCGSRVPLLTARPRPQMYEAPDEAAALEQPDRSQAHLGFQGYILESGKDYKLGIIGRYADRLLSVFRNGLRWTWEAQQRGEDYLATAAAGESLQPPPYSRNPTPIQTASPLAWTDAGGKEYLFVTVPDAGKNGEPTSPLSTLPRELLLNIMQFLSPGSLWSLRQSSPLFFRLFNKVQAFRAWHAAAGPRDRHVRFNVSGLTALERNELTRLLQKDKKARWRLEYMPKDMPQDKPKEYCVSCIEAIGQRENNPMKRKLRETRYCDGCRQRHLCVFFPPDDVKKYDDDLITELYCVGRLGTVTICSHEAAKSHTWVSLARRVSGTIHTYRKREFVCQGVHNEPCPNNWERPQHQLSDRPRLTIEKRPRKNDIVSFDLKIAWDQPLLDIDAEYPPALRGVQDALAKLVQDALMQMQIKPCRHMADGHELRAFAYLGICKCFCDPYIYRRVPRDQCPKPEDRCNCSRKQYLECRVCAATYSWRLQKGRITLSYRYEWQIMDAISPAWISLLDQGPKGLGMLTEDTKHLLWCDKSHCANGMGRRWEEMLKEAIWLQKRLYSNKQDKGLNYSKAWDILYERSHGASNHWSEDGFCLGGFQLAPHLTLSSRERDIALSQICKEIEESAVAAQKRG